MEGALTKPWGAAPKRRGKRSLCEQLKAGYRANAARDPMIAAEWFPLEEEAGRTFEGTGRQRPEGRTPDLGDRITLPPVPSVAPRNPRSVR